MLKKILVFKILFFLTYSSSYAQLGIARPIGIESSATLPKGVRNLRFKMANIPSYDKYDSSRITVGLGDALNKDVTYQDLVDGKKTSIEQDELIGALAAEGITDLNSLAGQTTGIVNVQVNAQIPVLAFGFSDKLTMAIAVPIVSSSMRYDTGFIASQEFQKFAKDALEGSRSQRYDEARRDTNNAILKKLKDNGYKAIKNEDKTQVGDIRLVGKYLFNESENSRLTLVNSLTLPTGKEKDIDKAVDVASGDGQFDHEIGLSFDYQLSDYFTFLTYGSYTFQFQDVTALRIPEKSDSLISSDIDPNVQRDLGDMIKAQVGFRVDSEIGWYGTTSLLYQYKQKDDFKGDVYSNIRYKWLTKDTEQYLNSFQLGTGFSTVSLFKKGQFMAPLDISVLHSIQYAGKNVSKDAVTSLELAMFF